MTNKELSGEQPSEEHDRQAQPIDREEPPRLPFPVIGIGASAGGLEAFIEFFDALPADPGMAFVLVQHLPPDRESLIAEILSKHTSLPVAQVEDGMQVEPNHVYVIRPGHTLTIKDGALHLGEPLERPGNNRPVDDFFRSLAEEQRERSICIILSGMGSNGTAGTEMVKAVGGLAIAQDPESAKYPSMPRHLMDSGNADYILRANEMPAILQRYTAHSYVSGDRLALHAAQIEQRSLAEILNVLRVRTRRDFRGYKKPTVLRRIHRRMGLSQIETLSEYAKLLRQSPVEVLSLSDDLMIHVTGFFRDAEAWEILRERVIVPLVAERESDSSIRCWVTACSSGEEAYTLCMLLTEAAADAEKTFDIKVFATDTADRTLSRARFGIYPMGIESEVAPERLERFFDRNDAVYRVKKDLREMVVFAPQNVLQDPPFSRLDICTCRNLLIYLEPELQRRVLSLLHFGLSENGVLFLGTSETVAGTANLFEPIDKRARIYRRIGPTNHRALEATFAASGNPGLEALGRLASIGDITNQALLDHYTPAAVTVDRQGQLVYFHGDTTSFLSQPAGSPTKDLLAMVHENFRGAVSLAMHKALTEKKLVTVRGGVIETPEGRFRMQVTVAPLENSHAPGHSIVSFRREPEATEQLPHTETVGDDVPRLQEQLRRTRDELQTLSEEYQATAEEMKASNEEAMSVNEELQSANEELETGKEELQSLNEELSTVNAQLQAKMEELEATTNDLSSLLTSTDIAVIFLDMRMRIRRFTPAVRDLVDLIPSDVGRPLSDMAAKFADPELSRDCQRVVDRLIPIGKEIRSASGHVYVRQILPYRTADHRIDGVVITFVDISQRKQIEESLRASEERFRVVVEGAPDFAMLFIDPQGKIVTWNVGAERLLGYSAAEAVGKNAAMIYPPVDAADLSRRMQQAAEFGRTAEESWYVRKSGSRFWGSGVMTAVHAADGEINGYVKVLRDDSARKQAEDERAELLVREQAARREAENSVHIKDQFLAMLSHELRTPISSILVWVKMLRQNMCEAAEREEGLAVIERSAEAQVQLLNDLLDTSRIASGKTRLERTETDLLEVVRSAVNAVLPQAKSKGVHIEPELANVGMMDADPDRLRQVVGNLLSNAIKFTPLDGSVVVRLSQQGEWVELTVSDTGKGIEADFLPRVFTAFSQSDASSTRSFGGLGLGLAISKELVELHGGTIHAQSDGADKGATFTVRLPLNGSEQSGRRKGSKGLGEPTATDGIDRARILLVEDEIETREVLNKLLAKNGAQVMAVATAAEAMQEFEKSSPDLIISDIGLPEQDGYHLLQQIRSLEMERDVPPTPAIALTAFAGRKDRRMARESGFHKHIAKPVSPAVLLAAISTLLADKNRMIGGE